MHDTPRPHDLLWGLTPTRLADEAPAWARHVLAVGQPVVVRRALVEKGQIAVGVRGAGREQRYGTVMPMALVLRCLSPEQLVERPPVGELPALRALTLLKPYLDELRLAWGPTGSVGFELATGVETVHVASDLDLVLRTPQPLSRTLAKELLGLLDEAPCRVDLQLETPSGAIALREWAGGSPRVLLKCATGARLVENPWALVEEVA